MTNSSRVLAALMASSLLVSPLAALAQAGPAPVATPADATAPAAAPAPSPEARARLTEGMEIHFTLDQALSSATSAEGDEFEITTSDPIDLGGGVTLPAGFHGRGVVTTVEKKGMLGKAGSLGVRLDYVRIGDIKVRLRSSQSHEGKSTETSVIVLSLLVTPLFLLMHGKDAVIPKGQPVTGYVDDDAVIPLPVSPPTT